MSGMIPSGTYKIRNVFFGTQYADLANGDATPGTVVMGHYEDGGQWGTKNRTFEITVEDEIAHIVTIRNIVNGAYATINVNKAVVEGGDEQKLQLLYAGEGRWVIHLPDEDIVWVLKSGEDWTQISAVPAPPDGQQGYEQKYWMFEMV